MMVVDVNHLTYRYGRIAALRDLDLTIPEGALYALLGPNGSGKTTLLQVLMGLRRTYEGRVSLMGAESSALTMRERSAIGYIAEGQALPGWMRLEQLEAYLAPLYSTWDASLARDLRERFDLDPKRKIKTLSRGEYMKAALLCALAPRPKLLFMDEPFTGMDALVKDELVRGLLDFAGDEGWTVVLCSHDIGELELLADWVGFLDGGRMQLSEPMDVFRARFKRIELLLGASANAAMNNLSPQWLDVERSGQRLSFVVPDYVESFIDGTLRRSFPDATDINVSDASLREVFVALAKQSRDATRRGVAA